MVKDKARLPEVLHVSDVAKFLGLHEKRSAPIFAKARFARFDAVAVIESAVNGFATTSIPRALSRSSCQ